MEAVRSRLRQSAAAFTEVARNPNLRRLALALIGSEIGTWGYSLALTVLAYASGGAKALGLLTLVGMLTPALAAPFTSVLGDRFDRVRVMLSADLVRAGLMAIAAAVAAADGPLAILYAIAACSASTGTAFRPAQAAILPALARTPEELTAVNVASSTIESVTVFAGPAMAGAIVAATDPWVAFAVACGTFLWSALLVSRIRPPARDDEPAGERTEPEGVLRTVSAGAVAIATEPKLRLLVSLISAQTLVSGTTLVLLPLVSLRLLGKGDQALGGIYSAIGFGGLIGAAAAGGLVGKRRLAIPFGIGALLWGAPLAVIAAWHSQASVLVLVGLIGVANTLVDVSAYTMVQRAVPDRVLSRVWGILESLIYGTHALGGVIAAALVEGAGLRPALIASGVFLPAIILPLWRRVAAIDAAAPPAEHLGLLRGVPFLAPLPVDALEHLAGALEPVAVPAGQRVFGEGDPGDRFYLIDAGEIEIAVAGQPLRRETTGEYFGEIALLRDIPRTATATALTDCELLALDRDEFIAAVTGHPPSTDAADAVVTTRLATAPRASGLT
jgi:MFS family permease